MLPIARWIGYGGETDFHGTVLETMTWATALLAKTNQITVFATIHVAANHPVVVAKQLATIDEISHGRAGLNIVALGRNRPEYESASASTCRANTSVAIAMRKNGSISSTRSGAAKASSIGTASSSRSRIATAIRSPGTASGCPSSMPQPRRRAPVRRTQRQLSLYSGDRSVPLQAGNSGAQGSGQIGRPLGRGTDLLHVVCRPTEKEAKDYWQYFAKANADWGAVDNLIALQFANAQSFPHDLLALIRDRMAAGHGGFPLVGTPEQVADGISQLHEAGFKGTTLSFVDYVKEFPYFRDHVMPILEARGLRSRQRIAA